MKGNKGLVLIDLLVSLALIGIFSIPILAMYDSARLALKDAQIRTNLILTAQNILEEYKENGNYNIDNYSNYQITVIKTYDVQYPQNLQIIDVYVRMKGNGQLCCHLKTLINTDLIADSH